LTNLHVSGCASLSSLDCSSNQLAILDVSTCPSLASLNCSTNLLTDLSSFVANACSGGLGLNDTVYLQDNPLSEFARTNQIPSLQSRGVTVYGPSPTWAPPRRPCRPSVPRRCPSPGVPALVLDEPGDDEEEEEPDGEID